MFRKKIHRFSPSISLVKFTTRTSDLMQSKRSRALTVQKHAMFQLYMLAPTHGASRKLPTLYCSGLSWMGDNTNAATVGVSRAGRATPLISRWGEGGTVQLPHLPWHRRKRSNKKAHRKCSAENLHSTFILPPVDESATCPITDIYWFHMESYSLVNPPTLELFSCSCGVTSLVTHHMKWCSRIHISPCSSRNWMNIARGTWHQEPMSILRIRTWNFTHVRVWNPKLILLTISSMLKLYSIDLSLRMLKRLMSLVLSSRLDDSKCWSQFYPSSESSRWRDDDEVSLGIGSCHLTEFSVVASVVHQWMESEKQPMQHAPHRLTRVSQRQKHGQCKRTWTERGGPNQRSCNPSEPGLAGGKPIAHRRRTKQSSRWDLAWCSRSMGGPGRGCWRCTGSRYPARQKRRTREVSESPSESAVEVAEPSRRSALQWVHPVSRCVCKSQPRSLLTPRCDILQWSTSWIARAGCNSGTLCGWRLSKVAARAVRRSVREGSGCGRNICRRGAILLILRECSGFNPRRCRHWRWSAGKRTGRVRKRRGKKTERNKRRTERRPTTGIKRTQWHIGPWLVSSHAVSMHTIRRAKCMRKNVWNVSVYTESSINGNQTHTMTHWTLARLEPCSEYAHNQTCKVHEKIKCEMYLSTPPVGHSGSPSTVNETNCNKIKIKSKKILWA